MQYQHISGAASANSQLKLQLLLFCGLILCLLMWAIVYRIYIRVDITLRMCYEHEDQFLQEITRRVKQQGAVGFISVNPLVGIWIPVTCVLMMGGMLVLALAGILKAV
jgi:hypothetical protein